MRHEVSAEEHYRSSYYQFLDAILMGLADRYDPTKTGLSEYLSLENMLLKGKVNEAVASRYPELDKESLTIQLSMFQHSFGATSLQEAKVAYRGMPSETRALFPQILVLHELLLVSPVTS